MIRIVPRLLAFALAGCFIVATSASALSSAPVAAPSPPRDVEDIVEIVLANGDTAFNDGVLDPGGEVSGWAVVSRAEGRQGKAYVRLTMQTSGALMDHARLTVSDGATVLYDGPATEAQPAADFAVEPGEPRTLQVSISVPSDAVVPPNSSGGAVLSWTASE